MTMIIKPFKASDFADMAAQPSQAFMKPVLMTPGYGEELEKHFSLTGFIDGRVAACAGIMPLWQGNSRCWAVIARDIGHAGMLAMHRAVQSILPDRPEARIEAEVDSEFRAGHRWVKMLGGFEWEGRMRRYSPEGRDCDRYARIKADG